MTGQCGGGGGGERPRGESVSNPIRKCEGEPDMVTK